MPTSRGKPYQSKLIPHEALIRELRSKRVSYREIARRLDREKGCKVYYKTIISFIRVRSKPLPEGVFKASSGKVSFSSAQTAIDRLKNKPAGEPPKQRFSFDPDKPLTLIERKS
jgi:hypothetical protein